MRKLVKESLNEKEKDQWWVAPVRDEKTGKITYRPMKVIKYKRIGSPEKYSSREEAQKVADKKNAQRKDEVKESLNEGFATEKGRNLDRIASMLGYDDFHEMLGDNPGLYEACIEWIEMTFSDQLGSQGFDPEELERLDLYQAADMARDYEE